MFALYTFFVMMNFRTKILGDSIIRSRVIVPQIFSTTVFLPAPSITIEITGFAKIFYFRLYRTNINENISLRNILFSLRFVKIFIKKRPFFSFLFSLKLHTVKIQYFTTIREKVSIGHITFSYTWIIWNL